MVRPQTYIRIPITHVLFTYDLFNNNTKCSDLLNETAIFFLFYKPKSGFFPRAFI